MRFLLIVLLTSLILGCTQPGTPIREHRSRGLPSAFPADFPLHVLFSVQGTGKKLEWSEGNYFVVKFATELKPHDIHYFFRKELATDRGYELVSESAGTAGSGLIVFKKGKRLVEITIGSEKGRNIILLRLKDKKTRSSQ